MTLEQGWRKGHQHSQPHSCINLTSQNLTSKQPTIYKMGQLTSSATKSRKVEENWHQWRKEIRQSE